MTCSRPDVKAKSFLLAPKYQSYKLNFQLIGRWVEVSYQNTEKIELKNQTSQEETVGRLFVKLCYLTTQDTRIRSCTYGG